MFYVLAYGDEKENGVINYRFLGWTRNEYAARIYNNEGRGDHRFYDNYAVFEYPDMPNCEFIKILDSEWSYRIRDICDESYISIYESPFGGCVALSSQEYIELILNTDVSYEQGRKHMYSAYEYMRESEPFIRDDKINRFIRELFARYCDIFKGYDNNPNLLNDRLSNIASFISMLDEEELPFM